MYKREIKKLCKNRKMKFKWKEEKGMRRKKLNE